MSEKLDDYIAQKRAETLAGAEGTPAEGTPAEGAPAEGTPAEGTPAEGAPAEGTPAEGAPAEGAPAEGAPAEGAPAEGTPAEGAPAEGAFEINDEQLNTFFETTGKTKDDIKNALATADKYAEIESANSEIAEELETIKVQNAELRKGLDPLAHFSSKEAYVAEQLRKKYPNMDAVSIQKAVTQDVTQMSDIDVLALHDTIKRPGAIGGEAMAKKILAEDYGVDLSDPPEQWDEVARSKIQRAAIDARQEIKTFQSEVEIPSIKSEEDLKAESAQAAKALQKEWEPYTPKLISFDKITIPGQEGEEAFEFEVPQSFRDELGEFFDTMITVGELEPTEETVAFLIGERNKDFIYKNLGTIAASIRASVKTAEEEKTDKELNNTTPPNTTTAPEGTEELSGTEKHLSEQKGRYRAT